MARMGNVAAIPPDQVPKRRVVSCERKRRRLSAGIVKLGFSHPGDDPENPGQWRAGVDGALPGVIVPGGFLLGSKYFQEVAFPVAADRAENMVMGLDVSVPAGDFQGCVEVVDTNSVEHICDSDQGDTKVYCPGVGLVIDEELRLVEINPSD
jgi:hypothetical protein